MTLCWRRVTLEQVAAEITVGYVGPMADEYTHSGVPFLRSLNIEPFTINFENLKYISHKFHNKIKKSSLYPGDVVIVRTGKPGSCTVVPEWMTESNCSDVVIVRVGPEIRAEYLSFIINYTARKYIYAHTVGAVQQHFNVGAARKIKFDLPSILEQDRILSVLGTLNKKIELNRQMNETLEATARALFRDWFVDFGPTRAKMEGRAPYLAPEIWDLFPDRLDDAGLPEGWSIADVEKEFYITMGQSPPGDTYNDENQGLPFFQGKTDFGFRYPENRKYCTHPVRVAQAKDALISVRAPVGDINLALDVCCIGRGLAAVRHKTEATSYGFYALLSIQSELRKFENTGTVFGAITKSQFNKINILSPSKDLIYIFQHIVNPVDDKIKNNTLESRTLAATRDLLLPKLMSGEIRVGEAAESVAGVT
ncbi:restriction endonuclease subunit S [Segnochrobactraceae bacterium EtOH-i3]